tara:strand:+ start:726 stop:1457 length:732 start_codon:yes stop_codon:yes gene_type:complete
MKIKRQFSLTLDIDWAPDEVIEYALEPIISLQIPATIFCTHDSEYLKYIFNKYTFIEAAIHPNFVPLINQTKSKTIYQIIDNILSIYPNSIGVRSHGHVVSSSILEYYQLVGLKYESGIYTTSSSNITPLDYNQNFTRIPHMFQDDAQLIRKLGLEFDKLDLYSQGLKVFDFHPSHLFINTKSIAHYQSSKAFYHQPQKLLSMRNNSSLGIKDIFDNLIKFLAINRKYTNNLKNILYDYKNLL